MNKLFRKPQTYDETRLLAALDDVINQACENRGVLDSMALTAYADAMSILEEYGLVEITQRFGRRVIAIRSAQQTAEPDASPQGVEPDTNTGAASAG